MFFVICLFFVLCSLFFVLCFILCSLFFVLCSQPSPFRSEIDPKNLYSTAFRLEANTPKTTQCDCLWLEESLKHDETASSNEAEERALVAAIKKVWPTKTERKIYFHPIEHLGVFFRTYDDPPPVEPEELQFQQHTGKCFGDQSVRLPRECPFVPAHIISFPKSGRTWFFFIFYFFIFLIIIVFFITMMMMVMVMVMVMVILILILIFILLYLFVILIIYFVIIFIFYLSFPHTFPSLPPPSKKAPMHYLFPLSTFQRQKHHLHSP